MAITQLEIADQMVKQLRVLDPSASVELGTPERKIIDTVAQALADTQIDINALQGAFDLDSKVGSDLDQFLAVFGFARQTGTFSSGVIRFSRSTPSDQDIRIPVSTQLAAQLTDASQTVFNQALFRTTADVVLLAGETVVTAPIRSQTVGAANNVAANTITGFVGNPVLGITDVTNPVATTGGVDAEDDNALKVRFRNTVFRNLAGTGDQFLALAITGVFTNKANVIGPISRFREYLQIPPVDDMTTYDVDGDGDGESGGGSIAGEYTTALSIIPYSKYTYNSVPVFLSNGTYGLGTTFYNQDVDFTFNAPPADKGDALRMFTAGESSNPTTATYQPNITAHNVYTGTDTSVVAIRPNDTVLFEHSYMSSASRNDWTRNITNCIDIYVNGGNSTLASTVIATPRVGTNPFVDDPTNRFHFDNFRRIGEPDHRPIIGNVFTPLFWTPIMDLPSTIVVDDITYLKGVHYWPVEDVGPNRGTIRARTGIEWSVIQPGQQSGDVAGTYTGAKIVDATSTSVPVNNYAYDKNIIDLQSAIEGAKQVTTDALLHQALKRYFKFDLTVMYVPGANQADTNQAIHDALDAWLNSLSFGSVIQLSDVLQQVHNVTGVDSVRWSRDTDPLLDCITETDNDGKSRLGVIIDEVIQGNTTPGTQEQQNFYLTGSPTGGTYYLGSYGPIPYSANAATVQTFLPTGTGGITVLTSPTPSGTAESPFRLQWNSNGAHGLLTTSNTFTGGTAGFNEDFFLKDDELPALPSSADTNDTLPGLIIRARTQSTWRRG